jgi:hypothetical protein
MKFAVIINGVVDNTIVADSLEIAEEATGKTCVEFAEESLVSIGWLYNGTTFVEPTEE